MNIRGIEIDDFVRGYAECALFAETDDSEENGGEPLDKNYRIEDFDDDTLKQFIKDCDAFREKAKDDLGLVIGTVLVPPRACLALYIPEWAGHDFWLTRNGHGAGFWDRGFKEEIGERLSETAREFGEVSLYITDDGKVGQG